MDEEAILQWERERAEDDEWEAQYEAELEMLQEAEYTDGPPAKRALYSDRKEKGLAAAEVPKGQVEEHSGSGRDAPANAKDDSAHDDGEHTSDSFPVLNSQVHFGEDYVVKCRSDSHEDSESKQITPAITATSNHGRARAPPTRQRGGRARRRPSASDAVQLPQIHREGPKKRQPTTSFITSTTHAGHRAYIQLRDPKEVAGSGGSGTFLRQDARVDATTGLLSTSFAHLQEEVDQIRLRQIMRETAEEDARNAADEEISDAEQQAPPKDTRLWVDEFSPRRYTDLISDEHVNKRLLRWLKRWDKIVFNRDLPAALFAPMSSDAGTTSNSSSIGAGAGRGSIGSNLMGGSRDNNMNNNNSNKSNQQQQQQQQQQHMFRVDGIAEGPEDAKVVLLAGPPGVGKTTLAHVVARHAGYATVEINASDDRSPDRLKRAVLDATQMREVLSFDKRPNCLVLDEIDGATTSAVNAVIRVIEGNVGKKGKSKAQSLRRPIICICNDLHASSVRALRKMAYVLHFRPIPMTALVSRLDQICSQKRLRVDRQVLTTLCELTDGDIRSCISTLHFLAQSHERISLKDIRGTAVGRKDKAVNVRSVWTEVFRLSSTRSRPTSLLASSASDGRTRTRIARIQPVVEANGEYEKIVFGLFENYLSIKGTTSFDPDFKKTLVVHDWLYFFQEMQEAIHQEQRFTLLRYASFAPAAFHVNFASPSRSFIRYPKALYDVNQIYRNHRTIVHQLLREASPHMRRGQGERDFVIDTLHRLVTIINPHLRIANAAVLSHSDRAIVSSIVGIMATHNLKYVEDLSDMGAGLRLEPRVDEIASFDNRRFESKPSWVLGRDEQQSHQKRRGGLPLVVKQLIARELVTEAVRRQASAGVPRSPRAIRGSDVKENKPRAYQQGKWPHKPERPAEKDSPAAQSQPRTQEEKDAFMRARMGLDLDKKPKLELKPKVKRDFFGRVIEEDAERKAAKIAKKAKLSLVLFKFHEGSSNAVRRPVRLRDLL